MYCGRDDRSKEKILVIDDNPEILEIITLVLADKGYELISSEPSDILTKLNIIRPDLIMIDNSLGEVSGSEICKELKKNNSLNHIPVILCSAVDDLEKLSIACNADTFQVKPFNLTELDEVVSKMLTDTDYTPEHLTNVLSTPT